MLNISTNAHDLDPDPFFSGGIQDPDQIKMNAKHCYLNVLGKHPKIFIRCDLNVSSTSHQSKLVISFVQIIPFWLLQQFIQIIKEFKGNEQGFKIVVPRLSKMGK